MRKEMEIKILSSLMGGVALSVIEHVLKEGHIRLEIYLRPDVFFEDYFIPFVLGFIFTYIILTLTREFRRLDK
jgi:hypothetical protein